MKAERLFEGCLSIGVIQAVSMAGIADLLQLTIQVIVGVVTVIRLMKNDKKNE